MTTGRNRVCPVILAPFLDGRIRRWLQDPRKILRPYIKEGMTVLDVGCGPGFFSIELARMVGNSGRVIASDLQEGMLQKLRGKIRGTELEGRITLHKSEKERLGLSEGVDFVLAFYMVHEVPNKKIFLREVASHLKPDGRFLIVEPKFHVSKPDFDKTLKVAQSAGLKQISEPKILFSRAALLKTVNDSNSMNIGNR